VAEIKDFPVLQNEQSSSEAYPPIEWVLVVLSLRVQQPGHEADDWPSSSPKVKNGWKYISKPFLCLHGREIGKLFFFFMNIILISVNTKN
jgi:hypothetical protein